MKLIKVGAAVVNQTPLDWAGNLANIRNALEKAKESGVRILCFPELCITGYGCEDAFLAPGTAKKALIQLEKIVPETSGMTVCIGLPLFVGNTLFNAAAVVSDGQILGFVCKQFLAGDGVHYEHRWFKPWQKGTRRGVLAGGREVPAGDMIFGIGGEKIGIEICEDAWNPARPARDFAYADVDVILNPSASHFAFGKIGTRRQIVLESSRFCNSVYIYTNLNGCESGRIIYDGGALIANCGKLEAQGSRFSFEPDQVISAVVDLDMNRMLKTKNTNFPPDYNPKDTFTVEKAYVFPMLIPEKNVCRLEDWEQSPDIKEEEFTRAVGLGLFDYMRKSGSKGFVLSISGGLDSGGIAVLIYYMALRIEREVGNTRFCQAFSFLLEKGESGREAIFKRILTCVYQASKNSGPVTLAAAKGLAEHLGFTFYYMNVSDLIERYVGLAEEKIGRKLDWDRDDMSLQNIQARVRGPGVWLLANVRGALLLTTSNRSEAAVGYATMDGDTCGGLCPLGGVDKNFLIHWMGWVRDKGPSELGPLSVVKLITDQSPTAELRPPGCFQTDEKDLMPYWILDKIEKAFVRERKSPREIFETLIHTECSHIAPRELILYIRRFFTLWQRNQWKRERYAPSFHIDDESLDPKSSCRYPILSGKFDEEFQELEKAAEQ